MAFDDNPNVDKASIYDDRANSLLLLSFSKEAGFIARAQYKDMGCDYKIELIERNGATNWTFDIQLKTVQTPRFVSDGQFLSFSIKTSRLGYLVRNAPIYGLLVIYDVGTDTFYYDLVDELYSRLMRERESEDWKMNEEVSVHIPCSNKLNKEALHEIHKKFLQRFEALGKMSNNHASRYGLPVLGAGIVKDTDIESVDDVVSELRSYGAMQLMQRDMRRVYDLLEKLPRKQIVGDRELLLIAVLAYCEVGRIAESNYYIERVSKKFDLNENEQRMVSFILLKNELMLGDINRTTFVERARQLLSGAGIFEELSIRLNILYYELNSLQGLEPLPERLVDEYNALESMISKVENEAQRMYIRAWNLDNLGMIAGHVRREDMNRLAIFKRFGVEMPSELRQKSSDRSIYLHQYLHQQFAEVVGFSIRTYEFTLTGMVMLSHMRFWMGAEMDILTFGNDGVSREKIKVEMEERIGLALETSEMLLQHKRFRQAYTILGMTVELLLICNQVYGFTGLPDIGSVKQQMKELEADLELPPFFSQMLPLIDKKLARGNIEETGMHGMLGLNDTQIRTYAGYVLESKCYPNAQLGNLVREMMALRTFAERAADERYELLIVKPSEKGMAYVYPSQFYIRDKTTKIESLVSSDMEKILASFGI